MEPWQVQRLVERDEIGTTRPLGGAIDALKVFSAIGQLDRLDVTPVDDEHLQMEFWSGQFVRLTLADRLVWLDSEETRTLIELLQIALRAAEENVNNA